MRLHISHKDTCNVTCLKYINIDVVYYYSLLSAYFQVCIKYECLNVCCDTMTCIHSKPAWGVACSCDIRCFHWLFTMYNIAYVLLWLKQPPILMYTTVIACPFFTNITPTDCALVHTLNMLLGFEWTVSCTHLECSYHTWCVTDCNR